MWRRIGISIGAGFAAPEAKPVAVQFHPVVTQSLAHDPLAPMAAIAYVAIFAGAALLTMRRPVFGVCLLIVVQPFALYSDLAHTTITLPKMALLGVTLGVLTVPGAYATLRNGAGARILLAAVLVAAATALSIAHATHHVAAIRETLKACEYVLLFATAYAAYRLDPQRRAVVMAIALITIAVSLLALWQEVAGAPSGLWVNGHITPRIAGPLEGPNQLAGYFDVALALLLALSIEERSALVRSALVLGAFADVLTFSRGGALGLAIAVVTIAFVYRARVWNALVFLVSGLVLAVPVALAWSIAAHSLGLSRFASFQGTNYAGGVGNRPELWHAAIYLWRTHPFFGVGAGNYQLELPLAGLHGIRTHANSLYLQSLAEGGIPGIAATLYLVYVSIATFVRDRASSPLVAGALAASLALAAHQIFDYLVFYPKVGGWWWIVLALGAAELAAFGARQPALAPASASAPPGNP